MVLLDADKSLDDLNDPAFWDEFSSTLRRIVTPVFREIYYEGVRAAASMEEHEGIKAAAPKRAPKLPVLTIDMDAVGERADAAIADYVNSWVIQMQGSTHRQLMDAILRSRRDGTGIEGVLPTAERLFGPQRGKTIAVTEVTNLFGFGLQAGYESAGVTEWAWQTVQDAYVDSICTARNGQRFAIDVQFEAAHPGCRCFPRPVLESMLQPSGKSWLARLADGLKFNPNHDRLGRFSSAPGMASVLTRAARGEPSLVHPDDIDDLMDAAHARGPVNLELVSISGDKNSNLFTNPLRPDISRAKMPQLPKDMSGFSGFLREKNVKYRIGSADPRTLRATQNQLNSNSVAGIYRVLKANRGNLPSAADTIIVSKDGGVLDGHHRWAAMSAYSAAHRPLRIKTLRVDRSMDDLLTLASEFSEREGIPARSFTYKRKAFGFGFKELSIVTDDGDDWEFRVAPELAALGLKFNPYHDARGRFASSPAGGGYSEIRPGSRAEKSLYGSLNQVKDLSLTEDPITRRPEGPRAAVLAYQGRAKEMNGYLRGTYQSGLPGESRSRNPDLNALDARSTSNVNWDKRVADMDGAFVNSRMPRNVILHRGVNGGFLEGRKPGDVIRDKAYVSTSTSRDVSITRFGQLRTEGQQRALIRLRVPKGVPAFAANGSEHEIILPRNTSMRINAISNQRVGRERFQVYDMEVIGVG